MTRMMRDDGIGAALVGVTLAACPAAAGACPLCYGSSAPQVLSAYYLSTAVLSLLPFTIIGVIGYVAVRMARRAQVAAHSQTEPAPEPTR